MIPGDSVIRLWFLHGERMEQRRRKRQRGNPASGSILHIYLFACHGRIAYQIFAVQIFLVHIHAGDPMVVVSVVVVDSSVGVTAGSVQGDLILVCAKSATAALLVYAAEDVEKLADAFEFGVAGSGVHFCEGNFGEAACATCL